MPSKPGERDLTRLALFGGPLMTLGNGESVSLTPSHERLLTLVWGHEDRGIHRASAIWLLWQTDDDRRSRQRLRQLLHDLGSRVGFRPVAPDGEDVLTPASAWISSDLDDFRSALGGRQLRRAYALQAKGFANRLDVRTLGPEYEHWLDGKRAGLRRRLRDAAARQWDHFHPTGTWDLARDAGEVLGALDPEDEASVMKLVEARAMTGSLESAHAAAMDYLARLPQGSAPTAESMALIERVRRMQPVQVASSVHTPAPPPLVGRRQGLATARTMLGRVGEGGFEFLAITGEAGAGKTRVMEEIWKEANLAGFRCLDARPAEVERRIPLSPLVDMLGDPSMAKYIRALEEPWRAVIASLLPTLPEGMDPPVVPPIAESSLSRRLLDAFATLLSDITAAEPLLLFVDDLQWADATTLSVFQFVQRRWRAGSLGIIATIRTDLVSGYEGVGKYLTDTPDLPVTRVELADLSELEARTLVDLVADQRLDASAITRLCALGGRNPFYLIELTRDYLAGKVHLPELPTDAITLPISLRQLLDPRIQGLGPEAASVGSYLAVWGRTITLPDLARLTKVPMRESALQVEELERCRLANVERGRVSFTHELFRSAIYQSLTSTRRALLHGQVAEFLEGAEGAQAGELAIHYDRAGNPRGAASHGRTAADRALESGAMAEAAYFLQLVVDNESDATLRAEATADLARVLHMNREILRANPLLELAASRLRAVGNHSRALRMDIRRVEGLAEVGAAPLSELVDRLFTIKSSARADGDDEALALALDSELHLLHRSGEVEAIRELFKEIRVVAGSKDPAAACLANASLALNVLFGDAEEALRCAREAVRVAEDGEHTLLSLSRLILALVTRGEMGKPENRGLVPRAEALAKKRGDLALRFQILSNQGVFFLDTEELDRAEVALEKAGVLLVGAEANVLRISHYCNLGELSLGRREFSDAMGWFEAARGLLGSNIPSFYQVLVTAGRGLSALELGSLREARALESLLGEIERPYYYDPSLVCLFRSRLHERRGDLRQALSALEEGNTELRERFPASWLRVEARRAQLNLKARKRPPQRDFSEAVKLAQLLDLGILGRHLRHLSARLGETS
jgi:DNA-binding SARP family transcriptional activator